MSQLGGFDDTITAGGFDDLINSNPYSSPAAAAGRAAGAAGSSFPSMESDNPFADMQSSSYYHPPSATASPPSQHYQQSSYEYSDGHQDEVSHEEDAEARPFERESAPEPEAYSYSYPASPFAPVSDNPLHDSNPSSSFLSSSSPTPVAPQTRSSKMDLSDLLGSSTPILPLFRSSHGSLPSNALNTSITSGRKVSDSASRTAELRGSNVSSKGKMGLKGPLASLLGFDEDEAVPALAKESEPVVPVALFVKQEKVPEDGSSSAQVSTSTVITSPHDFVTAADVKGAGDAEATTVGQNTPLGESIEAVSLDSGANGLEEGMKRLAVNVDNTPSTSSISAVSPSPTSETHLISDTLSSSSPGSPSTATTLRIDTADTRTDSNVPATLAASPPKFPFDTRPSLLSTGGDSEEDTDIAQPRIDHVRSASGIAHVPTPSSPSPDRAASAGAGFRYLSNASDPAEMSDERREPELDGFKSVYARPIDRFDSASLLGSSSRVMGGLDGEFGDDPMNARTNGYGFEEHPSPPLPLPPAFEFGTPSSSDHDAGVTDSSGMSGEGGESTIPLDPSPTASSSSTSSFEIVVGDPQKVGSALNVANQHTVYTVRTRANQYMYPILFSHFLWLFDALIANNPGVIVPGMPEKNALGRFGSDFVENRRAALQVALMKMVSHPMLVGDADLRLFLESDTFSNDIKQRKVDTPSEGRGFLATLGSSIGSSKFHETDDFFEVRRLSLESFETQLRLLLLSLSASSKLRTSLHSSLAELSAAFTSLASCDLSKQVKDALEQGGSVVKGLTELAERQRQSEEEGEGLVGVAEGYARMCGSVKLVFASRVKAYHHWQTAESHLRKARVTHEKLKRSGSNGIGGGVGSARIPSEGYEGSFAELVEAERRASDAKQEFEDVGKLIKTEMTRFDKEKVDDFKRAIEDYSDGIVLRQRAIVAAWQTYHDLLADAIASNSDRAEPTMAGAASESS